MNTINRTFVFRTEKLSTMQQLCSRCYKLYFNPRLGIHTHIPILFDYFHLSAITTTIHGSLLCLIPSYAFERYEEKKKLFEIFQLIQIILDRMHNEHLYLVSFLIKIYHRYFVWKRSRLFHSLISF